MRIFEYFINLIFWLWAFIVPTAIFSFVGFLFYSKSADNLPYTILSVAIGIFLGIWIAERIRKRHGLTHFFSQISASPELDNLNQTAEEEEKKENKEV